MHFSKKNIDSMTPDVFSMHSYQGKRIIMVPWEKVFIALQPALIPGGLKLSQDL